jgi:site-specific DNA recombinase
MRAALYARVSTERQADRGTIGSQLQLLREHIATVGDELAGEYVDDGHSGARLDRPGLDAQIRYRLSFRSSSNCSRVTPSTPGAP